MGVHSASDQRTLMLSDIQCTLTHRESVLIAEGRRPKTLASSSSRDLNIDYPSATLVDI